MMAVVAMAATAGPVEDFIADSRVNAPSTSLLIRDLRSGKVLATLNADQPLIPASIMKCVTSASLLKRVGKDYKYETPVYLEGRIHKGRLEGNIIVEGSADPSLNSRHMDGSPDFITEICQALMRKGVTGIAGDIVIDEKKFAGPAINPTWQSGDLPHAYGTGTHGFNFEDNASGKSSVKDPAGVFAARLRSRLAMNGIPVDQLVIDPGRHRELLLRHRSLPIDEIMRSCMMRSDNQFAEALLRTLSRQSDGDGSTANGAETELKYWRKHRAPVDGVKIVDGSGLSRTNRMTARFMSHLLGEMSSDPWYASFFPLAGQEGTLRKFMAGTPLEGYLAMKTGSMRGIQCYAGYLLDDDYAPTHSIVVMFNNMSNRADSRAALADLLSALFIPDAATQD